MGIERGIDEDVSCGIEGDIVEGSGEGVPGN